MYEIDKGYQNFTWMWTMPYILNSSKIVTADKMILRFIVINMSMYMAFKINDLFDSLIV